MYLYLFDPAAALFFLTCASVYTKKGSPLPEDCSGAAQDSSSLLPYLDFSPGQGAAAGRSDSVADATWLGRGSEGFHGEVRS
jgi:hypothetical protein